MDRAGLGPDATDSPGSQVGGTAQPQASRNGRLNVLPADLSRFLVDLSISLHRVAMYPPDHPSLLPALDTLARAADALLRDRQRLAVGVARDRLVIDGAVSEAGHPLLGGLAEHLYRHNLAAISFDRGVCSEELAEAVATLAEDPARGRGPVGRLSKDEAPAWPHVTFVPLVIDGLEIIEEGDEEAAPDRAASRCADLWVGLARAALERSDGEKAATATIEEPAAVAQAISDHQKVEAYDEVIVGYLLKIADELREAGGADGAELKRRVSTLVSTMQPEALQRLLAMGGDTLRRREFLRNAAAGMAATTVVDLVKSAAEASQETVSTGLVRLLTKLALHAETGSVPARPLADSALRLQVDRLIGGWSLADPSPSEYTESLERVARAIHPGGAASTRRCPCEPLRTIRMCLELGEEAPSLWRAVDRLVDEGQLDIVLETLERASAELAGGVRSHLESPATIGRLVSHVPPDFTTLDKLLPGLGGESLAPLFDVLTNSEDRAVRRAVFDRLRRLGTAIAPEIMARMEDDRWYVQRNLMSLVAEMEPVPAECDPSPWLRHQEGRVRREALRVALRIPQVRDAALSSAVADPDQRVLRVAVAAARDGCPPAAARHLVAIVLNEALDDDLRAMAVGALRRVSHLPQVVDALLAVSSKNGMILRGPALAPKSAVVVAALRALAADWTSDERAAALIRRAAASPEPEIRGAVEAAS